jgi:hypothetical protein
LQTAHIKTVKVQAQKKHLSTTTSADSEVAIKAPFTLHGRTEVETFFKEHIIDIIENADDYKAMGIDMVRVPYDIIEVSPGVFTWREISVKFTEFNYGGLVNALISIKYSSDMMTAVINNYLLDPENIETKTEFNIMQDYRKECKAIARTIIDNE